MQIRNLEKGGNSNSSAMVAEDVSEETLVAMLKHSAKAVQKSSAGWCVVVPVVLSFKHWLNYASIGHSPLPPLLQRGASTVQVIRAIIILQVGSCVKEIGCSQSWLCLACPDMQSFPL